MHVLKVRNVHDALPTGLDYLKRQGILRDSRNGEVVVAPGPVTTAYDRPRERVLFWAERDANPFFHFFEGLWMLAGKDDVAYVGQFVKNMKTFSDDGKTLHGAYGHRWKFHFVLHEPGVSDGSESSINQLETVIQMLRRNADDRRCVVQMWDASIDLARNGKDVPCNTQIYFSRDALGDLDMTVCCRSNDIVWGAYGANAVHFSMLQEYMAAGIGCDVGRYWQISNNYHAYTSVLENLDSLSDMAPDPFRTARTNPYVYNSYEPFPMVSTPIAEWMQDLLMFIDEGVVIGLRDSFFRKVATPMFMSHRAYMENEGIARYEKALEILSQCRADDWRVAGQQWLQRRMEQFLNKEQA